MDTSVFSTKLLLITIFEDSEELDNCNLFEVPDDLEGSSDDSDFQSPLSKNSGAMCSKSSNVQSRAQRRYDSHCKFQTIWAPKLPWVEGVIATDGILHMEKCKVCTAIDKKPCVTAPKSDTLFKHDSKGMAKKDLLQYKVKVGQQYITTQCKH